MQFDKEEEKIKPIYTAKDVLGNEILVGDVVLGATGTGSGYIFKGTVTKIHAELISVKPMWGHCKKVAPKRVRALKYEI
jgi:hypothetical protein